MNKVWNWREPICRHTRSDSSLSGCLDEQRGGIVWIAAAITQIFLDTPIGIQANHLRGGDFRPGHIARHGASVAKYA